MPSQKIRNRLFLSFPRRRESSIFGLFWTPASAGVTALMTFYEAIKFNHLGLIPRSLLRLCHSREGGNPGSDIFSGHPPELTPAKAEAGVTVVTLGQIPRSLLRGSSFSTRHGCVRSVIDGLVKSRKTPFSVIPAKAGIQSLQALLDSRLRGSDDLEDFLGIHHHWKV